MRAFILIGFVCVLGVYGQSQTYCNPALCTDWAGNVSPHIACPGVQKSQCPSDAHAISLTGALQQLILDRHNNYRNTIAGGQLSGFPSAKQMPTIVWSDEMAMIASMNAMQCTFAHDQCRNTATFQWAGQNIAWSKGYGSDQQAIELGVDGWWNEYKGATASDIAQVGNSPNMIGHFTAMSQDRTAVIGCAASVYNTNERLLVCNYAFTNLWGSPVYLSGSPASGCQTGTNPQYSNLCSTNEVVNPNPVFK